MGLGRLALPHRPAPSAVTIPDVPPAAPGKPPVSYRLRVPALDKDIDPSASTFKVKKNSVEVCLKKKNAYDHFTALASKKTSTERKEEKTKPDDPTARQAHKHTPHHRPTHLLSNPLRTPWDFFDSSASMI